MKIIAMTASVGDNTQFVRPRYANYLLTAAEMLGCDVLPVMLPITDPAPELIAKIARQFDAFLCTGGNDIDPVLYGEEKSEVCGTIEPERDAFELALLREVMALDKPVFGICRGCQVMAVACGASLVQDIPSMIENGETHAPDHRHAVTASGWVESIAGSAKIETNSYHHQSVKNPPDCLDICACTADGVIEAFAHKNLSYYKAVQWHPELNPDDLSCKLACDFLRKVTG
ncbi:MAG: gamma-glutamyl-gamma-aminobutyrate hydrolase family protein [Clostridia bacterium]|nr:gamma-glutamyl-gamma-aminobutyrate hydrolase family protein [Clostridia bacterium]